jgi:type II secretory pathway pseudopilin PulG
MLAYALQDCDPQIPIRRVDPLKDAPLSLQLDPRQDLAKKIAPILAASPSRELPAQLIRVTKEAMEAEARVLQARREYILDGLTPTLQSAGPKTSVVLVTSQFQKGMLSGIPTSPLTLTQDYPDPIRSRLPQSAARELHTDLFCRYVTEASNGEPITDTHAARATLARFIVFNALDNRQSSFLERKALPPSKTTRIALETALANELLHQLEDTTIKTILNNAANPRNIITYFADRDFGSAIQKHLEMFLERTRKAAAGR